MSKVNILVNFVARKGGGAFYSYEMTRGLVHNDCNVYAVVSADMENIDEWRKLKLAKLIEIPAYTDMKSFAINTLKFIFYGSKQLKTELADIKFDAVYIPFIVYWTLLIDPLFKQGKRIVTVHDPIPHSKKTIIINSIYKRCIKQADEIIVLSNIFTDYIEKVYKVEKKKLHVIPIGRPLYYNLTGAKETSTNIVDYDETKINFLFYGRITQYKGLHVLASAYRMLSKSYENISLTVVGSGDLSPYKEDFKRLINLNIINRWIKDEEVKQLYNGKNVVTVVPYLTATQSGIIPIAMEYNSAVIATKTGGIIEQIEDGVTGYLVEPSNAEELCGKMKHVVQKRDEVANVINNANRYINTLDWTTLSKKVVDII